MSNSIKCDLVTIDTFRQSIADAVRECSKCETDLSKAERDLERSTKDDGKISAEELFQKGEDARKNLFLKKTEAKRASDNLKKLKDEFQTVIEKSAPSIISALQRKLEEVTDSLRKQLSPLVAQGDSHVQAALEEFIRKCDDVIIRSRLLTRLRNHQQYGEAWGGIEVFTADTESALKML